MGKKNTMLAGRGGKCGPRYVSTARVDDLGGSERAQEDDSSKSTAWDANTNQTKVKSNDWSSWGRNKSEIQDGGSETAQEDSLSFGKWRGEYNKVGSDVTQDDSSRSNAWGANKDKTKPNSNDWSFWGRNKDEIQDTGSERAQKDSWSSGKWKAETKVGADMQENSSRSNAWDCNPDNVNEIQSREIDLNWDAKLTANNSSWGKNIFIINNN